MRIWLIGAGRAGTAVLYQLKKNPEIDVTVSDPDEQPHAVRDGIIGSVNLIERVTPINVNQIAQKIRPNLILIATGSAGSFGNVTGGIALADALNYEITTVSKYPCLVISRSISM